MDTEIRKLIGLLVRTFNKDAWHGPSVMEALEGMTGEHAGRRLPQTHSIIELVAHMTSWRIYVIRKLEGDAAYQVAEDQNFPAVDHWPETVAKLVESQRQLIGKLEGLADSKLDETVPGTKSPLTFYTLLHGIIHHDLYHTGQIALIKKTFAKQTI